MYAGRILIGKYFIAVVVDNRNSVQAVTSNFAVVTIITSDWRDIRVKTRQALIFSYVVDMILFNDNIGGRIKFA